MSEIINKSFHPTDVGLKRREFSLWGIYNEILVELFDFKNIEPYEITPTHEGWKFKAVLREEEVDVFIYAEEARVGRFKVPEYLEEAEIAYNFGFEISELRVSSQYKKTTYRDYIRILATVGEALKKFISLKKPDIVSLFSESKHSGVGVDVQKDDTYFSALKQNKIAGYELESVFDMVDSKKGLILYNSKKFRH